MVGKKLPPKTRQFLVLSAIAEDRQGVLNDLTRAIRDCDCNLVESRMTVLGGEFAMLMLISGNWSSVGRLESAFPRLEKQLGLTISARRTDERPPKVDLIPYAVDVVCMDQPGIVHGIASFFDSRGIGVADLNTRVYQAAHTGAPMFSVQMVIKIPSSVHIATLREDFMDMCDQLNLDAILEPLKG
ncbi:MAG: glycine cleavage system protein R [Gammaproteobacteria bacterium]|jgi:glycine cleavage system transcriptional repressor